MRTYGYNWHRYYDPSLGRYISADPIGQFDHANLYQYAWNNPSMYVDPYGLFNPAKGAAAFGNAANAGRLYASGSLKVAAGLGMEGTGIGAAPGALTVGVGLWNLKSGFAAQEASVDLMRQALAEDWDDATWKNLLGIVPFGREFDDPCEAGPLEVYADKAADFANKPIEVLTEIGKLF